MNKVGVIIYYEKNMSFESLKFSFLFKNDSFLFLDYVPLLKVLKISL